MENKVKEELLATSSFLNEALHTLNKIATSAVSVPNCGNIVASLGDCISELDAEFTDVKYQIRKEVINHEA